MRKKLAVFISAASILGLLAGLMVFRSASAIDSARTITVIAPDTEQRRLDFRPKGPSQGDLLVFAGPLRNAANTRTIGRIDGTCVTTSNPAGPEEERHHCTITSSFDRANPPGAEIAIQGVGRVLAEDVLMAVTGGTRNFQNVRGQALVDYTTAGQITITYNLIP
jgi:Dirigent-like protein